MSKPYARSAQSIACSDALLLLSKLAKGVAPKDVNYPAKVASAAAGWLKKHGLVFRGVRGARDYRYFSTQARADAYTVPVMPRPAPKPFTAAPNRSAGFKSQEALNPLGVVPTICPGFSGSRWAIKAPAEGFASAGVGVDVVTGKPWKV